MLKLRPTLLPPMKKPNPASLIKKRKWRKALQLLNCTRGNIECLNHRTGTKDQNAGVSLLTLAILHSAPLEVIKGIIDTDENSNTEDYPFGMTPLHVACACGSSYQTIRALTIHYRHKNNVPMTAPALDKCMRTPLHHLVHYICYPEEVDGGRAIFGSKVISMQGSSSTSSSLCSSPSTTSKPTLLRWKKRKSISDQATCEYPPGKSSNLKISQEVLEDILQTIQYLVHLWPEATFCQDIEGRYPIDILQDCKAMCDLTVIGPQWERADIACITLRNQMTRRYRSQKEIAERNGPLFRRRYVAEQAKLSGSVGTISTMEHSSITSGSIVSAISKLEVNDTTSFNNKSLSF